MSRIRLLSAAGALLLVAAPVLAQTTTTETTTVEKKPGAATGMGVLGGAATGAAVAGPVGAAVGAVVGAVVGTAAEPPTKVKTYITQQNVPSVAYDGPVAVGQVLPETVTMYDVPDYHQYRWAFINGHRVLIDRGSRKIVAILDTAGPLAPPPPEVRAYVSTAPLPPPPPAPYPGQIAVGQPLPADVTVYDVPNYAHYHWAYVNGHRVLIDTDTRDVVAILD